MAKNFKLRQWDFVGDTHRVGPLIPFIADVAHSIANWGDKHSQRCFYLSKNHHCGTCTNQNNNIYAPVPDPPSKKKYYKLIVILVTMVNPFCRNRKEDFRSLKCFCDFAKAKSGRNSRFQQNLAFRIKIGINCADIYLLHSIFSDFFFWTITYQCNLQRNTNLWTLPVDRFTSVSLWRCPRTLNCGSSTSLLMPTDLWPAFHLYRISRIV